MRGEIKIRRGPYELVDIRRESGVVENLWFSPDGGHRIHEEPGRFDTPFWMLIFDFDETTVKTEGPGKFFYDRRNILMQEANITGDENHLNALQKNVWKWKTNFITSVAGMLQRIKDGTNLSETAQQQLLKLFDPAILSKWAKLTKVDTQGDPVAHAAEIISERLEQIGLELLEKDPHRVVELAPLAPGIKRLFESLPSHVIVAIASGTRRETIQVILRAHARIGHTIIADRVGVAIAGEREIRSSKPNPDFYLEAMWSLQKLLREEGKRTLDGIQVADVLFFGDFVGQELDVSPERLHSAILLVGDKVVSPGPLAATVPSIEYLMDLANKPLDQLRDVTLRRFWLTMHPNWYAARRVTQGVARRALEIMAM